MSMDARAYLPDEAAEAALLGGETHSLARRACMTGSMNVVATCRVRRFAPQSSAGD